MKKLIAYAALLLAALTLTGCAWLNEPIEVPALSVSAAPSASATPTAAPLKTPARTPKASPCPSASATPPVSPTPPASATPSGKPTSIPSETKASPAPMPTPDAAAIARAIKPISPAEAQKLIGQKDVVLLDVRDQYEYDAGHITGAVLLPYDAIEEYAPGLPDYKDDTIIVYCRSGRRSAIAAQTLAAIGYTDIRDLGSIRNWPYGTVS